MFQVRASNLDALMRPVLKRLLSTNRENFRVESRKGGTTEILGAVLELTNPRARLSRSRERSKIFSALGELIWYLTANNSVDMIDCYVPNYSDCSDDGKTASGAYGPRIFSTSRCLQSEPVNDQWQRVIDTLRSRPGSRNGLIQLFSNRDADSNSKDIPCTCVLQFLIRDGSLHLHVHMRSNDAFFGLPHDIFSFTMLQEIAANELGVGLGLYRHSATSLHLYDDIDGKNSRTRARKYLDEGLHDVIPMPPMPKGNPWGEIRELAKAEQTFRGNVSNYTPPPLVSAYWMDLITLLKVHWAAKTADKEISALEMAQLAKDLNFRGYELYIFDRIDRKLPPKQNKLDLFSHTEQI